MFSIHGSKMSHKYIGTASIIPLNNHHDISTNQNKKNPTKTKN